MSHVDPLDFAGDRGTPEARRECLVDLLDDAIFRVSLLPSESPYREMLAELCSRRARALRGEAVAPVEPPLPKQGQPNTLLNRSKSVLAEDVRRLVNHIMLLWMAEHPMQDWLDPVSALLRLEQEATDRKNAQLLHAAQQLNTGQRERPKPPEHEWLEWSHGGKGVPWRVGSVEFDALLDAGWEIITVANSFTLLHRCATQRRRGNQIHA